MNSKIATQIIYDHYVHGLSYRSLGKKYRMSYSRVHRMVMGKNKKEQPIKALKAAAEASLPDDVLLLKQELRKARLKVELQDLMLDIASKELGVDLRKKHGTRRSK